MPATALVSGAGDAFLLNAPDAPVQSYTAFTQVYCSGE